MIKVKVSGKWNGYSGEFEAKTVAQVRPKFTPEQIAIFTSVCKALPTVDRKKIWNEINNKGFVSEIPVDGQEIRESLVKSPRKGLRWE
jgi:hypothetical protein